MEITEYRLTLTYGGTEMKKEIIYRGNENILIIDKTQRPFIPDDSDQHKISININRHVLEKFIEMIQV